MKRNPQRRPQRPVGSMVPAVPCKLDGPRRWQCEIPEVPPSENEQRRMHWARLSNAKKRWHSWLTLALRECPKATGHRKVTFIREHPGILDEGDNLPGAFKFVRDLLQPLVVQTGVYGPSTANPGAHWKSVKGGIGVIVGDGPGQATFEYLQRRIPTSEPSRTIIVIEEA